MLLVQLLLVVFTFLRLSYTWEYNEHIKHGSSLMDGRDIFDPLIMPNYVKRETNHIYDEEGQMHIQNSIIDSDNIAEWTPIASNLTAGQKDLYVFTVNTGSTSNGFSPTYEILIFLSGNLCNVQDLPEDVELYVTYAFNDTITEDPSSGISVSFSYGYLESLTVSPIQTDTSSNITSLYSYLYVAVEPRNKTTGQSLSTDDYPGTRWEYHLSISENDLVYQWDYRTWLDILDTDENSALLITGAESNVAYNFTIHDTSIYDIYVYSYNDSLIIDGQFNRSVCAIKNGNYLVSSNGNVASSDIQLDKKDLFVQKIVKDGANSTNEYFYVTGLNHSTSYVAYLTKKIGKSGNLSDVGGIIFEHVSFQTKDDNTCSLIHSLGFCSDVAYSVPTSSLYLGNKTLLAEAYENISRSLYANFSKALQLIPCDTESDARYSPLRTCDDCAESYRNWICSVSIPRCTTGTSSYYMFRNKNENRNSYIDDNIKPLRNYFEILPCIDMCYAIVRDCPSDFGFSCPDVDTTPDLLFNSYNFYNGNRDFVSCNLMGNDTETVNF
ncbi:similar to Saccharomyces cerevisiae YNL291C MID1 N-glycosylated integral membrane protein of the ER membrane and plasma membrane [Maudiozyma barnettii]|uniref:Similar to Saccharomyces cerevisiae YNL291C MID1 N-glycosylated integral membrane protein of the ER membrane and plasma membrane n=1 Tax=Maudiozyma barnettii TaxID=61262 RepID=A0A8H2VEF9_9SACH|nr:Mid1p [Kazachstania barnettii]CAB4253564.1 similar to Saccharomyces cerevisiae YNL291C MID1 N-glycosylated integral membrane protein of the ER membrane and plasma membrane [Kazachstania barnettii]CAD1781238.1 similar to Saccharomyces cerevisiae YNL291C MID1 N-glycosylated integral membrane protein of the ER membrane and plasma membrane [Kazachstania barnettii]